METNVRTEVIAGITNYFSVIYMVFLVPEMLMGIFPEAAGEGGELIKSAVVYNGSTAGEIMVALTFAAFLAAGIGSVLMGIIVNLPFVQGPSLTIATFIVYTVCRGFGYSYGQALAIVFISGICFFIMSWLGIEKRIHKAIPKNIQYAVTVGIGIFVAFIGIDKAHIIAHGEIVNFLDLSDMNTRNALLALSGVIFIAVLLKKHIHGAVFIGKLVCIVLAVPLGLINAGTDINYNINAFEIAIQPDFTELLDISGFGAFMHSASVVLIIVFSICIMDIFETMGMVIAARRFMDLDNNFLAKKKISNILQVDSASTAIGSALGITSVSTYAESTTGIIEGGRTGLTAVVTGILLMLSVFFAPFVSLMPSAATATTLIMAGVIMMQIVKYIDFHDEAEAVPAFFTIIMMPVANSIIFGISFGMLSYLAINVFSGNLKKVKPTFVCVSLMLAAMVVVARNM